MAINLHPPKHITSSLVKDGHVSALTNDTVPSAPGDFKSACFRAGGSTHNVIILTSGLSGSSVLTGLIARANYWAGTETAKKEYDTYENVDLIRLNVDLLREVNYSGRYEMEFRQDVLDRLASMASSVEEVAHGKFLAECDRHQPWVWKDPRLWLTIRYWNRLLDWNRCKVVVLTRGILHCWVSTTLRRQIRSYQSLKSYEMAVERSILEFLASNSISHLRLTFEELIGKPEETIHKLNGYIGSNLEIRDLQAVYRGKLYKSPRNSPVDFFKAVLIYAKNRSERWDLKEKNA